MPVTKEKEYTLVKAKLYEVYRIGLNKKKAKEMFSRLYLNTPTLAKDFLFRIFFGGVEGS